MNGAALIAGCGPFYLVKTRGLEPLTPCSQSRCSTRLSYVLLPGKDCREPEHKRKAVGNRAEGQRAIGPWVDPRIKLPAAEVGRLDLDPVSVMHRHGEPPVENWQAGRYPGDTTSGYFIDPATGPDGATVAIKPVAKL